MSWRPSGRLSFLVWLAVLLMGNASSKGTETNLFEVPSDWMRFYGLRTSVGYRDNVLLSPSPRGSGFASAGGDVMVLRLPGEGLDGQFFLSADRTQFFASDVPDSENTILGVGKISSKHGHRTINLTGSYLFQDQVLDVSATDPELGTVQVRLHDFSFKPGLRYDLRNHWFVEFEPMAKRQEFAAPLDDLWEGSAKAMAGRGYGFGSRATVSAQASERWYDEKSQRTHSGDSIPGTSLQMHRLLVESSVEHYWDAKRVWKTQGRVGYLRNLDNGTGYFDFHRWFAQVQGLVKRDAWQVRAQVRFDQYIYDHQAVSASNTRQRREHEISGGARLERKLSKSTAFFMQYDCIASYSKRSSDEYLSQTVSTGAQWEF